MLRHYLHEKRHDYVGWALIILLIVALVFLDNSISRMRRIPAPESVELFNALYGADFKTIDEPVQVKLAASEVRARVEGKGKSLEAYFYDLVG